MADNKVSFLMYRDWLSTFENLENEEAGLLIKHILRYVNDQDPTPPSRVVQIVFEPLKQQLRRDLKKWEVEVKVRTLQGRLGNLKRWNIDLYNRVKADKMTIDEAEQEAVNRKASRSDKNHPDPTKNVAVKERVTVTVIDTVKEIPTLTLPTPNGVESKSKDEIVISDHPLVKWIKDKFPNVAKLRDQLTNAEAGRMVEKFDRLIIADVLRNMENHKQLTKKYTSVNLTMQEWCKRRIKTGSTDAGKPVVGRNFLHGKTGEFTKTQG